MRGRRQFQKLYSQGKSWKGRGLRIRYLLEPVENAIYAIATPRALGNAVHRNRIRRVFREAIRQSLDSWPSGSYHIRIFSIVGRPTRAAASELLERFTRTLSN